MSSAIRPILGFISLVPILLCACAKQESVEDSWQMQPPVLEMQNSKGTRLQLKSSEVLKTSGVMSSLIGDEAAFLQFAPADRDLKLDIKSTCSSPLQDAVEYSDSLKTSESVAIIGLVPPMTLSPEGLAKNWICDFKLRVTNKIGSTHQFGFSGVRLDLVKSRERLNLTPIDATADSNGVRGAFPRRLICSSWWTDSSDRDLASMARESVVHGSDNRSHERQPHCTVLELAPKARLIGTFRPVFPAPAKSIERLLMIQPTELKNLFHRPLVAWYVRNDSTSLQTYFIATKKTDLQISGLFVADVNGGRVWSKPVAANPYFYIEGTFESAKSVASGFYFRVQPGGTAKIILQSNRGATSYSHFDFTRTTHQILITTERALEIRSLVADLPNFANMSGDALDAVPRDPIDLNKDTLLKDLNLEPVQGVLREADRTREEALRQAPRSENSYVTTAD